MLWAKYVNKSMLCDLIIVFLPITGSISTRKWAFKYVSRKIKGFCAPQQCFYIVLQ